jgi:hypothetical protein
MLEKVRSAKGVIIVIIIIYGTSETFLCFMPVRPIQIVPPAGVQLLQIQFVINWMSSEGKLSHLVRCDIIYYIITRCPN